MNLVALKSFDVEWNLPNLDKVKASFEAFAALRTEEALIALIGVDAYNDFVSGVESADATYLEMLNGAEYTYQDKTYKWAGMEKLLAPYVYSEWVRRQSVTFTGVGAGVQNSENLEVTNPHHLIVDAKNAYAKMAGECYSQKNTLYGWLKANAIEVDFCPPKYQNVFGL